jgi:hypothetical protein
MQDTAVSVKLKLAALWTATLMLFLYGDVILLWRDGAIEDVQSGELGGFDISQGFLLAVAIYVTIPALMIVLSLLLAPRVNRRANIAVGALYALTIIASAVGEDWVYYFFLSAVETVLVLLVVRWAWSWPPAA